MKELLSLLNFDARTKEGITNITVWMAMLVYFLFINFFIVPVNVSGEKPGYIFYLFVLFVPAAVRLIFFSGDSISHASNSEAEFFQAQFPDRYIEDKFKVNKALAQHLWFRALDKRLDEGEVQRTYEYGYTCRLVYYLRRLMRGFALVSCAVLIFSAARIYLSQGHGWRGFGALVSSFSAIPGFRGKSFYVLHLLLIFAYLTWANRPSESNPTGVWRQWRSINNRSRAWVDQFKTFDEFQAFANAEPPLGESKTNSTKKAKPKATDQSGESTGREEGEG